MKVAYVFRMNMASTSQLASMILPQLESGTHGVQVVGMFFFDDNIYCLRATDPIGLRLSKVAKEKNILLMICDQCAVKRNMAIGTLDQCGSGDVQAMGTVDGVQAGCFPQLYNALSADLPDQIITL